ncbi:transcriptional regulator [Pigmentiphaga litoralis]|uniref:LysR family transcriptional regulator n=1 Tax=Pigmentiphaga litoralis TaxID=516702 RepID=UPI0016724737|nr:LysR family transcriptional regulator [Pigmentiphaga litoralis]GGX02754.1 transcriptional regulator [Pigmentiphaga litoralis]
MARLDINRSGEMEVFVRAIELGGFSAAARACGMTPSAVSKLVARLEQRLGTRLVNRSTRQLQLTPEGCVFYERSVRILADMHEAERCASTDATPRGKLRVNANVPFGHHFLLPLLPAFLTRYPDMTLDIVLTDEVVDILEARTDVAVRAGPLKNSNLLARKLGATRMIIVAAPSYLEQRGTPATPEALTTHNRLGANYARVPSGWPLVHDGSRRVVPVSGNVQASDGEALHRLAVAGLGLARLAAFQVRDDIAAGRLVPVLEDCNPGDVEEIHAVYVGQGGHVPLRVRAFLDFLVETVRVDVNIRHATRALRTFDAPFGTR